MALSTGARNAIIGGTAVAVLLSLAVVGGIERHNENLSDARTAYASALSADKASFAGLNTEVSDSKSIIGDAKTVQANDEKTGSSGPGSLVPASYVVSYNGGTSLASVNPAYVKTKADTSSIASLKSATAALNADSKKLDAARAKVVRTGMDVLYQRAVSDLKDTEAKATTLEQSAQSKYDDAAGKVADENTRTTLKNAIASLKTTAANKNPDKIRPAMTAVDNAVNTVNASVDTRNQQIAAAQAAAAAAASAAQAQSSGSASGYSGSGYTGSGYSGGSYYRSSSRSGGSSYSGGNYGGYNVGVGGSCTPSAADPVCQNAVNTGGLIDISYSNGTRIYAQHNETGGAWIKNLGVGQTVTVGGQKYQVTGTAYNQVFVPGSGTYMQTCTNDGRGTELVGIKPIG